MATPFQENMSLDEIISRAHDGEKNLHINFDAYPYINELIRDGIERYLLYGIPPGGFLQAIIRGDVRAILYADDNNRQGDVFHMIVSFFYNEVPGTMWGAEEAYCEMLLKRATIKEKQVTKEKQAIEAVNE